MLKRTKGEDRGRHHYGHVEGDVTLCMRKKVDENEAKSKQNEKSSSREKCDGGSKKKTKNVENEKQRYQHQSKKTTS